MKTDVFTWYDECLTCIRFRKRPTRQDQVAVKPTSLHPWQEVMIDCEGSSRPPDAAGNTYVLSYFCCLTHAVLLEPMRSLTHTEVRRAFSRALVRSGTIPKLLRSDRGPEFKNTLMAEFVALIGLRHRFGAPWRPNEQSGVERVHQEVQKVLGMLIQDVLQAEPSYWTEVLPVVEFVIYNTPGPHGYTPRDIDRRWSLGAPLEHDLEPFDVLDFEPLSDHVRNIFAQYKQIRNIVLEHSRKSSSKRAALANRFRRDRKIVKGMRVVYRDPRVRAAGGRTPWKQPATEPLVVAEVSQSGNKLTLRREDGSLLEDVHAENVVLVPETMKDLERHPLVFRDAPDDPDRESPGQKLEAVARGDGLDWTHATVRRDNELGILDKISVGVYVAYSVHEDKRAAPRQYRIGRVTTVGRAEMLVVCHKYLPTMYTHRLRVEWTPAYLDADGQESIAPSARPVLERVVVRRIITPCTLNQGVVNHSTTRKLDTSKSVSYTHLTLPTKA